MVSSSISGKPRKATLEAVRQLLTENHVDEILCDVKQNGNRDRKKELPVWIPQAASFINGTRKAADAVPSGFFFLDIDEKGLTEQLWQKAQDDDLINKEHIVYFAESAGGGTHIWARRTPGQLIGQDIERLANRLGVTYDSHVTDLSRCCFMVSERYVKLLDPVVFEESEWDDRANEAVRTNRTDGFPTTYNGIPYHQIASQLLLKKGYGEQPVEGNRNNALYDVSRYLRFICDFSAEWIFQVVPHWGLSGQEALSAIRSAVGSTRPSEMPKLLKEVLQQLTTADKLEEEGAVEEETGDEWTPSVPQRLPALLQTLVDHAPNEFKEAVLMDAMPMLGTLCTGVRAKYRDGKVHAPSFMVSMVAPQATGKSFASDLQRLLLAPVQQQDDAEWQKEMEYNKLCKECGKGERPADPMAKIRILPPTLSNTMLLKRAVYAKGEHLFTYAPEIETVTKGNKAGAWSQKNDLFRIAFDNEEWGQLYMSDQSFSGKTRLYYNVLMCGTPRTTHSFFTNVEDGLVTRIAFVKLPDMTGARMPKFKSYTKDEEDDVKRQCMCLMDEQGEIELPRINAAIDQWDESKRQEYLRTLRGSVDVFRRRAAVIGFRAGMVAYELCDKQESEEAIGLAVWMAERVFQYQMELFGSQMDRMMSDTPLTPTATSTADLLALLGTEFTKDELVSLRRVHGQSEEVRMVIHRWKQEGLIRKVGTGLWRKAS